jgi:hypothetical protein
LTQAIGNPGLSEYQYCEFLAVDRPLEESDRRALRGLSTRARITATQFVNSYEWGDFKGDPAQLMFSMKSRRCAGYLRIIKSLIP